MLSEVRNLSEMITSFLNFARPQPLQLETVALADLIEACADELAPLYQQRHVDLHVEVANYSSETDRLEVSADERMLRQAHAALAKCS
jgi:signal transduction histidine kinase